MRIYVGGKLVYQKQEQAVAEKVGGKTQPNSGGSLFKKGDVVTDNILIECKTSNKPKDVFTIKVEWLKKMKRDAISAGKEYAALAFDFGDQKMQYFLMSEQTFDAIFGLEFAALIEQITIPEGQKSFRLKKSVFEGLEYEEDDERIFAVEVAVGDKVYYIIDEVDFCHTVQVEDGGR